MALRSVQMDFAGQIGVNPRLGRMVTTDSLETITTAGYLNNQNAGTQFGTNFLNTDILFVAYDYNDKTGTATTGWFSVSVASNGQVTLSVSDTDTPEYVQDITPGTSAASKAIVLNSSSEIDGVLFSNIEAAGTFISSVTAAPAEVNLTHLQPASVTTSSTTPASGTCAAQFQLKTAMATNIAAVTPIWLYISTSAGSLTTAASGIAALTNGALTEVVSGAICLCTTNASGQLGITLTASSGTYYVSFVLPDGKVAISSALVVD